MPPFLALITPIGGSGNYPDNSLPMPQPPIRPPQPPIAGWPGGLPGGGGFPGQGGPVDPGYGVPEGGRPTHPIYNPAYPDNTLPQPPLGFWGPNDPRPTPPIYIPPDGAPPPLGIWGPPDMPPGFWGGGMGPGVKPQPPKPTHPIVLPPDLPPVIPPEGSTPERPIDWKVAWTPLTGWVVIGIPAEGTLVPTPSR